MHGLCGKAYKQHEGFGQACCSMEQIEDPEAPSGSGSKFPMSQPVRSKNKKWRTKIYPIIDQIMIYKEKYDNF